MQTDFTFGFSGGDIDAEDDDMLDTDSAVVAEEGLKTAGEEQAGIPPCTHRLEDLLSSYRHPQVLHVSQAAIPNSPSSASSHHDTTKIPHRASFDIRMALMASPNPPSSPILAGVDLIPGTYEGGWQIWEGALDLAAVLEDIMLSRLPDSKCWRIIELGAGVGLPTLSIFKYLVQQPLPDRLRRGNYNILLSDYNIDVLTLATTAALLLTWIFYSSTSPLRISGTDADIPEDIEIGPDLVLAFETDLVTRGIEINAISGSWGQKFLDLTLMFQRKEDAHTKMAADDLVERKTLILSSETLYSPEALELFMLVLMGLLNSNKNAEAYVASKTNYFGTGGNVNSFTAELEHRGGRAEDVMNKRGEAVKGVKREVLKVVKHSDGS